MDFPQRLQRSLHGQRLNVLRFALLALALILLFIATLSVPISKSIYLGKLTLSTPHSPINPFGVIPTASTSLVFGAWGFCTTGIDAEALGITEHFDAGGCYTSHLGYTFNGVVAKILGAVPGVASLENAISKTLTGFFTLLPIALVLAVSSLLLSFLAFWRSLPPQFAPHLPFITAILILIAAVLTTVAAAIFGVIIGRVASVVNHLKDFDDGVVSLDVGNAIGIAVAAAVFLWLSGILSFKLHVMSRNKQRTHMGDEAGKY
ncbi:hypothetical protein C8R46DRAFT_1226420 [Mycena filopes]|nr:hypothetical protein C8R46DRAFT_1226420 [Mycena filopes]